MVEEITTCRIWGDEYWASGHANPDPSVVVVRESPRAGGGYTLSGGVKQYIEGQRVRDEYVVGLSTEGRIDAAETVVRDWESFVSFYDFPVEHWVHLLTRRHRRYRHHRSRHWLVCSRDFSGRARPLPPPARIFPREASHRLT